MQPGLSILFSAPRRILCLPYVMFRFLKEYSRVPVRSCMDASGVHGIPGKCADSKVVL